MSDKTKNIKGKTLINSTIAFSTKHEESEIELVLVHVNPELVLNDEPGKSWRALEFWTSNTMYGLDSSLTCIEVSSRDPQCGRAPVHLIGARLVGSQRREGDSFAVSFPYPVPGMDAVFQKENGNKFATTSVVERVMMRVRMTNIEFGEAPNWEQITKNQTS